MDKVVIANFYDNNGNKSGGDYAYYVPPGDNPKPGDLIITSVFVEPGTMDLVPSFTTVRCAVVQNVLAAHPKACKYYLLHISKDEVFAKRAEQQRRLEAAKERQAVVNRLEEMAKTADRMRIYEEMARVNPEAAVLLAKLKGEDISAGVPIDHIEHEEMGEANIKASRVVARRKR